MPIYEYRCDKCKAEFELLVRDSDVPECPKCSNKKIEKQLSVTAAPNMNGSSSGKELPMMDCGASRCCGGGCQM